MACEAPVRRRATRQLELVLAAVRSAGEHPTAEQVHRCVRSTLPSVSLGTVYRNLQRLVGDGAIGMAQVGSRVARFDPTPEVHDHFVCEVCGRIDDLPRVAPAVDLGRLRRQGHEVTAHAVVLYGQCGACRGGH